MRQLSQFTVRGPHRRSTTTPAPTPQYWSAGKQQWITAGGSRTVYALRAPRVVQPAAARPGDDPRGEQLTCSNEQLSAVMVQGDLTVPPGSWCDLVDTSVAGDVHVSGTGLRIAGSTIDGDLEISGVRDAADPLSSGLNVVCNTTIGGRLVLHGSARSAPWSIGLCGGNTVKGSVIFSGNAGHGNAITGNTIEEASSAPAAAAQPPRATRSRAAPKGSARRDRGALTSRRAAAAAGARPPRRPLAVRLAAQFAAAGMLAAGASGCGSGAGAAAAAPGNVFRTRQQVTLDQAERAISAVYRSHPAIGAFTVQDVQYTASSWRAIWRKCARNGTAAESPAASPTAESGQVIACAPLIFFLYSYGRTAAVPASAAAAGDVYWYAVTHIGGPASVRAGLDELLRSWKLPVRPLTAAQARSAAAASVVTAARNAILAQRSVHLVITGRKPGGAAAERIIADIGAAAGPSPSGPAPPWPASASRRRPPFLPVTDQACPRSSACPASPRAGPPGTG